MINVILLKGNRNLRKYTLQKKDIFLLGFEMKNEEEVFNYPTSSLDIGIIAVTEFMEALDMLPLKRVRNKCILINIEAKQYVITLLHI